MSSFVRACLRARTIDDEANSAYVWKWLDSLARCTGPDRRTGTESVRVRDELPPRLSDFVGRGQALNWATKGRKGPTVLAVNGMPGAGKTAFGIEVAHRLAVESATASATTRLHVDLRGHQDAPLDPFAALGRLLAAIDVPERRIPVTVEERAALWRATTVDRSVFLFLDDAVDTPQVRPLLPRSPDGFVLVTSRGRLTGLDGADILCLPPMTEGESMQMFVRIVGRRARSERGRAAEVLAYCAGVPLAIRLAAERLVHRPSWTVADLASRLRDARRGLAELECGERSVMGAFERTFQRLDVTTRRFACELAGAADVGRVAVAAMSNGSASHTEKQISALMDANVMTELRPGWYRFNPLIRTYLREHGR